MSALDTPSVRDMIRAANAKNPSQFAAAFNTSITQKVRDEISVRRAEVAGEFLAKPVETGSDDE